MWRELIQKLEPAARFAPPVEPSAISAAGEALGTRLPEELYAFLEESNGVRGKHGVSLVWPLERIVRDNLSFRRNPDFPRLYMPFDSLLFFADAGDGDQFAFRILMSEVPDRDVYVWNHENDSRSWCAPGLGTYLEWWLAGRIKS